MVFLQLLLTLKGLMVAVISNLPRGLANKAFVCCTLLLIEELKV